MNASEIDIDQLTKEDIAELVDYYTGCHDSDVLNCIAEESVSFQDLKGVLQLFLKLTYKTEEEREAFIAELWVSHEGELTQVPGYEAAHAEANTITFKEALKIIEFQNDPAHRGALSEDIGGKSRFAVAIMINWIRDHNEMDELIAFHKANGTYDGE